MEIPERFRSGWVVMSFAPLKSGLQLAIHRDSLDLRIADEAGMLPRYREIEALCVAHPRGAVTCVKIPEARGMSQRQFDANFARACRKVMWRYAGHHLVSEPASMHGCDHFIEIIPVPKRADS